VTTAHPASGWSAGRTSTLDHPEPVAAGSELVASVYVDDNGPGEWEASSPLDLPADREVRLRVLLVTCDHFEVDGEVRTSWGIVSGYARYTSASNSRAADKSCWSLPRAT
jgi:hypothetical protein